MTNEMPITSIQGQDTSGRGFEGAREAAMKESGTVTLSSSRGKHKDTMKYRRDRLRDGSERAST